MDLILFGMQGAGKGTLSKQLAERYNMKIFETGGELRRLAQEDSELGKKIKSIIEAGHLVSNEVVMEIVENFMKNLNEDTQVIFDGIPRSPEQAKSLNALLDNHNRNYKAVLIEIKKETALSRLTTRRLCKKCKTVYPSTYNEETCTSTLPDSSKCDGELITRKDDTPDAIKTRLQAFEDSTVPAIEIYSDKLIKINGEPTIDEVAKTAFSTLNSLLN